MPSVASLAPNSLRVGVRDAWRSRIPPRRLYLRHAFHGRWENFWATGKYSRVDLVDDRDVLAKMVYTLTNPVAAGLVSHRTEWPGVISSTLQDGPQRIVARKPEFFFREGGKLPDEVELIIERPPGFPDLDDGAFGDLYHRTVLEKEREIRATFKSEGREFLADRRAD